MEKVVNKTVKVLTRFGERIERRLYDNESDDEYYIEPSGSPSQFRSRSQHDILFKDDLTYPQRRKHSSDHIAGSPSYSSFRNYRQNPFSNSSFDGLSRPQYGTGLGTTTMPYPPILNGPSNFTANYPPLADNLNSYGQNSFSYGSLPSNSAAYAPEYYIAERRQIDLVPAPRPQIIQQPVPVPVPIDRPVPVPVPVPVPTPVMVDRPVPVPVPAPSPPPQPTATTTTTITTIVQQTNPVCVPVSVSVPSQVPCYVSVAVPVPSPPPSPVIFENSVAHTQRWITGPPIMGTNPYTMQVNRPFMY